MHKYYYYILYERAKIKKGDAHVNCGRKEKTGS